MSLLSSRPSLRWLAPVGVAVAVLAAGGATQLLYADAGLPKRSAEELLTKLQTAEVTSLSGTVVEKADLGFPSLPVGTGRNSSDLASLVDGSHTLRLWYDGPERFRMALLGTLGESDVIRNGQDLWTWHSEEKTATHTRLPAGDAARRPPMRPPRTPQEAADQVLEALDPSTKVTTDGTARVAGRAAYELVLTPRDDTSLVRQVRLAVDGEKYVPLRVQVYADSGAEPALQVGFTQVSFAQPDPAQFRFTPPPGTEVTERPLTAPERGPHSDRPTDKLDKPGMPARPGPGAAGSRTATVGEGWTTVLVMRTPDKTGEPTEPPQRRGPRTTTESLTDMLEQLPKVSGDWGSGRVLKTKLFTALLTDDGRVLVGAVTPDALYAAAKHPDAQLKAGK